MRAALLLVLLAACGSEEAPAPVAEKPQADAPPFPSLAPFEASRMWKLFADRGTDRNLQELRVLRAMKKEAVPASDPSADALPGAPPAAQKMDYAMAPMLVAALRSIWAKDAWDETERALVAETFAHLHERIGAPAAEIGADQAQNRAALARFARWFEAEQRKPASLGAMIFTMDNGPYRGLDDPAPDAALADGKSVAFGDGCTLVLGRREKHYVLRFTRGGKTVTSRVLSQDGSPVPIKTRLLDQPPTRLGDLGWKLHLMVGGEYCHVYASPEGALLFYFISW